MDRSIRYKGSRRGLSRIEVFSRCATTIQKTLRAAETYIFVVTTSGLFWRRTSRTIERGSLSIMLLIYPCGLIVHAFHPNYRYSGQNNLHAQTFNKMLHGSSLLINNHLLLPSKFLRHSTSQPCKHHSPPHLCLSHG